MRSAKCQSLIPSLPILITGLATTRVDNEDRAVAGGQFSGVHIGTVHGDFAAGYCKSQRLAHQCRDFHAVGDGSRSEFLGHYMKL